MAGRPALVAGILMCTFGAVDRRPQLLRLGDGRVGVVREVGGDLDRHAAVDAVGGVEHGAEDVGGVAHVVGGRGEDRVVDAIAPALASSAICAS